MKDDLKIEVADDEEGWTEVHPDELSPENLKLFNQLKALIAERKKKEEEEQCPIVRH